MRARVAFAITTAAATASSKACTGRRLLSAAADGKLCGSYSGVIAHPNPLGALEKIYGATIEVIEEFPKDSFYAAATRAATEQRLAIVKSAELSVQQVEQTLGEGPIEFAIDQAVAEFRLATSLLEDAAWEPLAVEPPSDHWDVTFTQRRVLEAPNSGKPPAAMLGAPPAPE